MDLMQLNSKDWIDVRCNMPSYEYVAMYVMTTQNVLFSMGEYRSTSSIGHR